MNNIDYKHGIPQSFQSRLIQIAMVLFGMKKKIERKMITNGFIKEPAKIPDVLFKNFKIEEAEQNGRKVWTISPVDCNPDLIILYFHGGAYISNLLKEHWSLIEKLTSKTGVSIIVPDYPLAPEAGCTEIYDFIEGLFTRLITDTTPRRIILMGDSAGGGLALGYAQQLRAENKKQPDQIIIFSPWLDVTMSDPMLERLDKVDNMLSIDGLKNAGQKYAADLDLKDFRVSPVYGDLTGLCRISVFTGTRDILNADAQKIKQLMKDQNISFNYFEYPDMFHDWVIITSLKESCDVINKVINLVNDY